jgi:DNA-binding MarR family transcriptional regulator/GNAT superfamily N-acetyltransferase
MDQADALRDFNRVYTRELGLLARSYLGSGLGLGEARVLFELTHGGGDSARDIAEKLGLDEGYLSRVLKGFERRGWLERRPGTGDARRRCLCVTEAGRRAIVPLEERSRQAMADRLNGLSDDARTHLFDGARLIRSALGAVSLPGNVALTDLQPGDAGWVISRHGALYARDEGYDIGFEALVAGIVARFIDTRDPVRERAWIARDGGQRLGCVFCARESDSVARLRLFLLEPAARGRGLGRRMLEECLGFARQAGYARMVLWTHESHRTACALYAAAGFQMTDAQPATAFGQSVVDQTWERAL